MTLDDVSKQLTRGLSNLRADIRENAIMVQKIRDEVKAVHELVADQPTRGEFNELREDVRQLQADLTIIKQVVKEHSRELAQLDARVSALEAA